VTKVTLQTPSNLVAALVLGMAASIEAVQALAKIASLNRLFICASLRLNAFPQRSIAYNLSSRRTFVTLLIA
jgi:hypothetical protein